MVEGIVAPQWSLIDWHFRRGNFIIIFGRMSLSFEKSSFALLPPKRLPGGSSSSPIKHSETYDLAQAFISEQNMRVRRNTEQFDGRLLRNEVQRQNSMDHEDYLIVVHRVEREGAYHHDRLKATPINALWRMICVCCVALLLLVHMDRTQTHSRYIEGAGLVDRVVVALESSADRGRFESMLGSLEQHISEQVAAMQYRQSSVPQELYWQTVQARPLALPKANSLTDNYLRTTLGCEESLANSYIQILDCPQRRQQEERKQKQQMAKKKFAQGSTHRDLAANTKPFMTGVRLAIQRPVIDNEHDSYLKTQLIFLEQPKGSAINTKQYFDRHADLIAKKINELGGLQDTIGRMEDSLSRNEVRGFRKKQVLSAMSREKRGIFSPTRDRQDGNVNLRGSWVNRSREMRQSFMSRMHKE